MSQKLPVKDGSDLPYEFCYGLGHLTIIKLKLSAFFLYSLQSSSLTDPIFEMYECALAHCSGEGLCVLYVSVHPHL
jgi:hypothetical protein